MYFHHLSLSAAIVAGVALFGLFYTLLVRERTAAIRNFQLVLLFTLLLYLASFLATSVVSPVAAYHRWLTVAFAFFTLIHLTQYFLYFGDNHSVRLAAPLLIGQWVAALVIIAVFVAATVGAPLTYRFDAHYWDLNATFAGRLVAIGLLVYAAVFVAAAVWRIRQQKRPHISGLVGILLSFSVAFMITVVALLLFRMGLLNAVFFANISGVAAATGLFLAFFFFINYSDVRTSVLSKIVMITLLCALLIVELVGSLGIHFVEDAYDYRKLHQSQALLNPRLEDTAQHVVYLARLDGNATAGPVLALPGYEVNSTTPRITGRRVYRRSGDQLLVAYRLTGSDGVRYEIGYDYREYREHIHAYVSRVFVGLLISIVAIIVGFRYFFHGAIIAPLRSMITAVKRVNSGDLKVNLNVDGRDEIGFLSTSFNTMVSSINEARQELQQYTRNLERKVRERDSFQALPVRTLTVNGGALTYASKSIEAVIERIERIAHLDQAVLIRGETGTGKELIARLLHEKSRGDQPYVDVNCAAIPATLWESEIFGHKKGAFTDARNDREGLVAQAARGTLFFDEIGEMPLDVQPKILRLLQERRYQMVGGKAGHTAECRIVFATHRDLREMVEQGKFREDLYYRINVLEIDIPPLRERKADIPVLFENMLQKYSEEMGVELAGIEEEVMDTLIEYPWRGNVRELENAAIKILAHVSGDWITTADLPEEIRFGRELGDAAPDAVAKFLENGAGLEQSVETLSRQLIEHALMESDGNISRAARMLKISRGKLQYQMRALHLQ